MLEHRESVDEEFVRYKRLSNARERLVDCQDKLMILVLYVDPISNLEEYCRENARNRWMLSEGCFMALE